MIENDIVGNKDMQLLPATVTALAAGLAGEKASNQFNSPQRVKLRALADGDS